MKKLFLTALFLSVLGGLVSAEIKGTVLPYEESLFFTMEEAGDEYVVKINTETGKTENYYELGYPSIDKIALHKVFNANECLLRIIDEKYSETEITFQKIQLKEETSETEILWERESKLRYWIEKNQLIDFVSRRSFVVTEVDTNKTLYAVDLPDQTVFAGFKNGYYYLVDSDKNFFQKMNAETNEEVWKVNISKIQLERERHGYAYAFHITNDHIFIMSRTDNYLYCIDSSGNKLWREYIDSDFLPIPKREEDGLYITSYDEYLIFFNRDNMLLVDKKNGKPVIKVSPGIHPAQKLFLDKRVMQTIEEDGGRGDYDGDSLIFFDMSTLQIDKVINTDLEVYPDIIQTGSTSENIFLPAVENNITEIFYPDATIKREIKVELFQTDDEGW